jgi:hypothetical protein
METNKKQFTCECGKKYIHQTGLLKHQKQCAKVTVTTDNANAALLENIEPKVTPEEHKPETETETEPKNTEIKNTQNIGDRRFVMGLIEENQELKRIILKQHEQLENQDERLLEIVKAFFNKIIKTIHQTQTVSQQS